jgi:hypothetical protein
MVFQRGAEYWEKRKKQGWVGQPKKIPSPEDLWELFCEYCQWVDTNPIKKEEVVKSGWLAGQKFDTNQARPYTWGTFELYVHEQTGLVKMDDYKSNKEGRYSEYTGVIQAIDSSIREQKFAGASAGHFNANIISRDLGLADKQQVDVKVEQPLFGDEEEPDITD